MLRQAREHWPDNVGCAEPGHSPGLTSVVPQAISLSRKLRERLASEPIHAVEKTRGTERAGVRLYAIEWIFERIAL